MIKLLQRNLNPDRQTSVGNLLYLMLCQCINSETNRVEFNGKAMNVVDMCAYANFTMKELYRAMRDLYSANAIANVRMQNKDFYYINPAFARDDETPDCLLDWLVDLFETDENLETKGLIYFKKGRKTIAIDIGSALPDERRK